MKNGVYALLSLDGAPPSPRDMAVLGLDTECFAAPGCVLKVHDVRASAVRSQRHSTGVDALLGYLDEPRDAAAELGLPADSDPLSIALAMVARHGDRAPARLLGAWLLLRWHAPSATLTLLMAERVRDTCYVATNGARIALSPELLRLARLGWVDATPDPIDLCLSIGQMQVRRTLGNRTFLRGVTRVMPGTCVTLAPGRTQISVAEPPQLSPVAATISFDAALERIDAILRRIVRQHFEREGDTALLLSGGLDSSLLALYAARERGNRTLTCLTSAAPPGSDLPDERAFAASVAIHLGVEIHAVAPPAEANVYRPTARTLAWVESPLMSFRHYLDEALEQAALDCGASATLDGTGGEMSVTNFGFFLDRAVSIRTIARAVRDGVRFGREGGRAPGGGFHAQLSRAALDRIPDTLKAARRPRPEDRRLRADAPLGFEIGVLKAAATPSWSIDPAMRAIAPFYDRRLLRYTASLPAGFTRHAGLDRAIARSLMAGQLPDSIVFRRTGMPYSPSYRSMLTSQAGAARDRIATFRQADLDQWVDLDWLDTTLWQIQRSRAMPFDTLFRLQQTALFAEFLLWWTVEQRQMRSAASI